MDYLDIEPVNMTGELDAIRIAATNASWKHCLARLIEKSLNIIQNTDRYACFTSRTSVYILTSIEEEFFRCRLEPK
jgi:hypothetical protein